MKAACAVLALGALLAGCGGDEEPKRAVQPAVAPAPATTDSRPPAAETPAPPAPSERIPRTSAKLSARLTEVSRQLSRAIKEWRATERGKRATPPRRVTLLALYQQRAYRLLARRPRLASATIRRLRGRVRAEARDSVGALDALFALTSLSTEARFRTGRPQPPDVLRGYYLAAQRRFGVRWNVLAAVNFIESNFGRLKNVSSAGAVGPMQFIPSTWRAYGMGGDIRDPRDAIFGAANYLRASGAPRSYERAVYAYNPSRLYVAAVLRYARRIGRDPGAYYAYWSWQSFKRTRAGDLQLTGPGAR